MPSKTRTAKNTQPAKGKTAAKGNAAAGKPRRLDTRKLEHELQGIVDAATAAGDWQPGQADRCKEIAQQIAKARRTAREPIGDNIARWL